MYVIVVNGRTSTKTNGHLYLQVNHKDDAKVGVISVPAKVNHQQSEHSEEKTNYRSVIKTC
jgi:hypothetical protein